MKKQISNVGLFFMPHFNMSHFYLSLPVLSAYLNEKNIRNMQIDLNIESIFYFMKSEFLSESHELYCKKEQNLYLIKKHETEKKYLIKNNTFIKDSISSSHLFFIHYERIKKYIDLLYEFISSAYDPFSINSSSISFGDNGDFFEIEKIIINTEVNPYIKFFENYLKQCVVEEMDFIAISLSCYSQLIPTITFCEMVKKVYPNLKVCIGGNVFTKIKYKIKTKKYLFKYFDFILLHEGEEILAELINTIRNNLSIDEIGNIVYMKKGNVILKESIKKGIQISSLPLPNYSELDKYNYLSPIKIIPYYISRSCYWGKCTFCDHDYGYDGIYRIKSLDKIIFELKEINKIVPNAMIFFVDEALPFSIIYNMSKEIIDKQLKINWFAYIKADKNFSEEICKMIYRAGCKYLMMGAESCSERLLNLMEKGITKNDIITTMTNMNKAGIWLHTFLIHNFPTEKEDDILETLLTIKFNKFHSIGISNFVITRNSKIGKELKVGSNLYYEKEFSSVIKEKENLDSYNKYIEIAKLFSENPYNNMAQNYLIDFQHIPIFNSINSFIFNPLKLMYFSNKKLKINFIFLLENSCGKNILIISLITQKMVLINKQTFEIIKQFDGYYLFDLSEIEKFQKLTNDNQDYIMSLFLILFDPEE